MPEARRVPPGFFTVTALLPSLFFLCAALVLCAGCRESKPAVPEVEGAGTTEEKAVVIQAKTEQTGYKEQLDWTVKHFPDYQMGKQALLKEKNQKVYQRVEITTGGKAVTLFFDITGCYGMSDKGPMHFE